MKKIILILFLFIAFNSYAQKPDSFTPGEIKYSAEDSVVTDAKNNTIHLYGKASFEHNGVNFQADDIMIDKNSKLVVATGQIKLISARSVESHVNSKNRILRYTMGEPKVVIE